MKPHGIAHGRLRQSFAPLESQQEARPPVLSPPDISLHGIEPPNKEEPGLNRFKSYCTAAGVIGLLVFAGAGLMDVSGSGLLDIHLRVEITQRIWMAVGAGIVGGIWFIASILKAGR